MKPQYEKVLVIEKGEELVIMRRDKSGKVLAYKLVDFSLEDFERLLDAEHEKTP